MSWVFLTDTHDYTFKKPARGDCETEIVLRRPLAPDIYLGMIPPTASPAGQPQLGGGVR